MVASAAVPSRVLQPGLPRQAPNKGAIWPVLAERRDPDNLAVARFDQRELGARAFVPRASYEYAWHMTGRRNGFFSHACF